MALTEELGAILDHAAQVSALDTRDVPPTAHPLPIVNVFRPTRRARAPARRGARGCSRGAGEAVPVPRILGEEP